MRIMLSVWVPGRPKTKGSLAVVNARGGAVRESVVGSKRWRMLMCHAVRRVMVENPQDWPLVGRVRVSAIFALPVEDVTAPRAGDVDKLARNLLDALQDAGVYADDVQVAPLILDKVPAGERGPGVALRVWQ